MFSHLQDPRSKHSSCLCYPGACGNIIPFEVYELLDLGPLKKSREVFTIADASIVSIAEIAEDVLVKIGQLTIPADFHVIMPTDSPKTFSFLYKRAIPASGPDQ
ncbi:hypothetical protein PIB30_097453, partial [Stylosanthes scabra]|nr:hypothetical protein [Stylosanthes scabra]